MEIHMSSNIPLSPREEPSMNHLDSNSSSATNSQNTKRLDADIIIPGIIDNDDNLGSSKTPNSVITPNSADLLSTTDSDSLKGANSQTQNHHMNTINSNNNGVSNGNSTNNNNAHNHHTTTHQPDDIGESRKININQIDEEVSKILMQLDQIEKNFNNNTTTANNTNDDDDDNNICSKTNTNEPRTIKEIRNLIDNFKSTVLRLNLKNTLVKNQLLTVKDDYLMERYLLINKIENLENTLRIIQDENNAVNSRNLKLIKYIRTLKNEKIKMYMLENKRLREHIEKLEDETYGNLNAIRINHPQRYSSITSPLTSATSVMPPPMNLQYPNANSSTYMRHTISNSTSNQIDEDYEPYQIRQQINSPTNFNMLDTLGRLATEYLHNEYPDDDRNENHIDHA